jgi:hypothetical protein
VEGDQFAISWAAPGVKGRGTNGIAIDGRHGDPADHGGQSKPSTVCFDQAGGVQCGATGKRDAANGSAQRDDYDEDFGVERPDGGIVLESKR